MITDHYWQAEFTVIPDEPYYSRTDHVQMYQAMLEGEEQMGVHHFRDGEEECGV